MGSFLEKYNASEWDTVASHTIHYLKMCRKLLSAKKNLTNEQDIERMQREITKLVKNFLED